MEFAKAGFRVIGYDVSQRVYASGKLKSFLNPFTPVTPEVDLKAQKVQVQSTDDRQTLADALGLMAAHQISGIPVVERGNGKLAGILTNRDVRFATDNATPASALMTKDRLITVREGATKEEAKRLLHQYRIEKLLVVDDAYRCIGLITVKDIEKAVTYPNATKDESGRLRVAAASTVGDKGFERTRALIEAEVDVVIIDTAHGHNQDVARAVESLKRDEEPPPPAPVVDTGPLLLPLARRTPAVVCWPIVASMPSRARMRHRLRRSCRVFSSGGSCRLVLLLVSKPLPAFTEAQLVSMSLLRSE